MIPNALLLFAAGAWGLTAFVALVYGLRRRDGLMFVVAGLCLGMTLGVLSLVG